MRDLPDRQPLGQHLRHLLELVAVGRTEGIGSPAVDVDLAEDGAVPDDRYDDLRPRAYAACEVARVQVDVGNDEGALLARGGAAYPLVERDAGVRRRLADEVRQHE